MYDCRGEAGIQVGLYPHKLKWYWICHDFAPRYCTATLASHNRQLTEKLNINQSYVAPLTSVCADKYPHKYLHCRQSSVADVRHRSLLRF